MEKASTLAQARIGRLNKSKPSASQIEFGYALRDTEWSRRRKLPLATVLSQLLSDGEQFPSTTCTPCSRNHVPCNNLVPCEFCVEQGVSCYTDPAFLPGLIATQMHWLLFSHAQPPLPQLPVQLLLCKNLTRLSLNDNGLTDVWPVATLTDLVELQLESNRLSDLRPLAGLTKLVLLTGL